jgi:signal peptidase I
VSGHEPPPQGPSEEESRRERARSEIRHAYDLTPSADPSLHDGSGEVAGPPPYIPASEQEPRPLFGLPRSWQVALDWALTIFGAILIVLIMKNWVVNPYRIPSSSMEPTLHCAKPVSGCEGHYSDRVLANRFIYDLESPHRGQIVVFTTTPKVKAVCSEGGTFVKRLIGIPGDTISYNGSQLKVNGDVVQEPYIPSGRQGGTTGHWHVPKGGYFFMGDNRQSSCDSRRWGSIPFKNLIGPIFAIYWPPTRIWVATPGVIGGLILGALALVIAAFVFLGTRRRRTPEHTHALSSAFGVGAVLVVEFLLYALLLAWGDSGTKRLATIVGVIFGCVMVAWVASLAVYLARERRPRTPPASP